MENEIRNSDYHFIEVTEAHTGEKLSFSVHWEANINDWVNKLKLILKFITFDDKTIDEYLLTDETIEEKNGDKE